MKKLYFINNWKQSLESFLVDLKYHTPEGKGIWKDLTYTTSINEADYFIFFEGLPAELRNKVDYSKSILIRLEPPWIKLADTFLNQQQLFYQITYDSNFGVAMWWSYIPFNNFNSMPYQKTKGISCLMSSKTMTEGHRVRLEFFKKYLQKYSNVEVFGRNLTKIDIGECFKGELSRENTNLAYKDYKYSFVCENGSIKNYTTARFFDCILNWSIPIYWGATNIYNYIPEDAVYTLDVKKDNIEKLYEISQRLVTKKNINALAEARQLILYKYNIWERVYQVIKKNE